MMNRVEIVLTKKGLLIYAVILVILDIASTLLVASSSVEVFLESELNLLVVFLFLKYGYTAFLMLFFISFGVYYTLISLGFWLYEKNQIFIGWFYFIWVFLTFHIFVIINNLLVYWVKVCKA